MLVHLPQENETTGAIFAPEQDSIIPAGGAGNK